MPDTLDELFIPDERTCPFDLCDGSGELVYDVYNHDAHAYDRGVGTKHCLCVSLDETQAALLT